MSIEPSTFANLFTFARASVARQLSSSGAWASVSSGDPRTDHHLWNGTAWVPAGLLLETEARTNLWVIGAPLPTQGFTVTAVPHTLSFTGTGTVTLSGASTAGPLVGAGTGEQNRVSLTFTPSAGTLTCTVSGTVTNVQLEAGRTPSSYTATPGSQVTRSAETLSIAAADMPYSPTALCGCLHGTETYADEDEIGQVLLFNWNEDSDNRITVAIDTITSLTGRPRLTVSNGGASVNVVAATELTPGDDRPFRIAWRVTADEVALAFNGTTWTATGVGVPGLSGTDVDFEGNGTRSRFLAWDRDIGNAGIEEASA